jgi:CheY-like chemotaxis protein
MKHVLDVGQCGMDHGAIRHLVERELGAKVAQAHDLEDALTQLRASAFDLVLVNRKLDANYADGMEVIQAIKADVQLAALPVMLVSNFPEAQAAAVAAGAEPGFGKSALNTPATRELLSRFLKVAP